MLLKSDFIKMHGYLILLVRNFPELVPSTIEFGTKHKIIWYQILVNLALHT